MSREAAAEACGPGFSARNWKRWETDPKADEDEKTPRLAQIAIIARALNVDREWLAFGGNTDTWNYPSFGQPRLPLADGWDQLDEGRLEWTTRKSLPSTESGKSNGDSPTTPSGATEQCTDRSSRGSQRAA